MVVMCVRGYIRGHEIYYDDELKCWCYKDNGERVYNDDGEERVCSNCNKPPIDDVDFCLYGLRDCNCIEGACCGHGVEQGYILLKDGRRFVLEQNLGDDSE